jgi:iron complex outermembrane receptor protein
MTFDRADTYRNSFVMIRGLTQITNADSPLAVVIDGVPQNDQKQFNMRLFDIERIEVTEGPQGHALRPQRDRRRREHRDARADPGR